MKKFFLDYRHENNSTEYLNFAKKKEGWYVQIKTYSEQEQIIDELLFWSVAKKNYQDLSKMFDKNTKKVNADEELKDYLEHFSDFINIYNLERCRYYGYNEWDADMIKDFGNASIKSDTLLEGLARAYANYAERFLWSGFGGYPFDNDTLKSTLERLQIPSKQRMQKFIENIDKAIKVYKQLTQMNPNYRTRIGNASMKVLNEQFHVYQQLQIAGYSNEAKEYLKTINADEQFKKIGYNYLNACPKNSILFVFGDNDTYPLWYLQDKEGFRKDVTIINYSLIGFPPYVDILKRKNIIPFSSEVVHYGSKSFDLSYYNELPNSENTKTLNLVELIRMIQDKKYAIKTADGESIASYPLKLITWEIDSNKLSSLISQTNFCNTIKSEIGDYLMMNDFLVFDIVFNNYYSRPVYFSAKPPIFQNNIQMEGPVFRLLPIDATKKNISDSIESKKTEDYILKYYKPIFSYPDKKGYQYAENWDELHNSMYLKIISFYVSKGDIDTAKEWANKYLHSFSNFPIVVTASSIDIAKKLIEIGYSKDAILILEEYGAYIANHYNNFSSLEWNADKDEIKNWIQYLIEILTAKKLNSPKLTILLQRFD